MSFSRSRSAKKTFQPRVLRRHLPRFRRVARSRFAKPTAPAVERVLRNVVSPDTTDWMVWSAALCLLQNREYLRVLLAELSCFQVGPLS